MSKIKRDIYNVKTSNRRVDVVDGATVWVSIEDARAFTQFKADCKEDVDYAISILCSMGMNILKEIPATDKYELVRKFEDKYEDNREKIEYAMNNVEV